jgi:hypothetical protein
MPSSSFPLVANNLLIPIDGAAATPSLAFGGSPGSSSGTGLYGTYGSIKHALSGSLALTLDSNGLTLASGQIKAPTGGTLAIGVTIIMTGAGAPVDGTTGDNVAGPGSLYSDITNGKLYIQTSLITTPVWVLVGSQT